jgi:hypothetical protein
MLADPSKLVPFIVLPVANLVAVAALPVILALDVIKPLSFVRCDVLVGTYIVLAAPLGV